MNNFRTASHIFAEVLGLPLPHAPAGATATVCGYCAVPIPPGGGRLPIKANPVSFNDWGEISSGCMCPACAATVEVSAMRNAQRAVVTAEAIYSAATYSHRSWLMMNPPTGESVWTYSTLGAIAAQHLVWRTPITRDASSLIYMRLGNQLFPLRRKLILEGVDAAKTVAAAIPLVEAEAEGVKKKKPKPLRIPNHPFATLGDMADPGHGVLRTNLAAWAEAAGNAAAVRLLRCLTPGEKWALMPLLYTDKHPPTKPKILTREDFLSDKPLSVGTEA